MTDTTTSDGLDVFDLCIVGGGINGAGIARDAAGQGLKVVLLERKDLGAETSSASSKLVHGGLRYLEYFEFGLVRKALKERDVLLSIAPHIIHPMRFVLPHDPSMRPVWMVRAGLWLYDHLGGKSVLPKSQVVDLKTDARGAALRGDWGKGFAYSDCRVDDARLVVLNAMAAREKGAVVLTQEGCDYLSPEKDKKLWRVRLDSGKQLKARMIVNASGPWVRQFLGENGLVNLRNTPSVRLVRGSHIVVPKLYDGDHAFIIQNGDGRIVFAWPYYGFTAIGTTEVNMGTDPDHAAVIDAQEKAYLCQTASRIFNTDVTEQSVVSSWSGVRALLEDGAKDAKSATRDYKLYENNLQDCPVLSVFGGKITTYRKLAEDAMAIIGKTLGFEPKSWTGGEALPGGDIEGGDMAAFVAQKWRQYSWLPQGLIMRYALAYGTRMDVLLEGRGALRDLGRDLGHGLHVAELDYLKKHEWAREADDVLWRRTKLGLVADPTMVHTVANYLNRPVTNQGTSEAPQP